MKSLFFTLLLMFSPLVLANVPELASFAEATKEATNQVESLFGQQAVIAYQVTKEDHELEVEILSQFQNENFVLSFGCDEHGDHFDCHEEGEDLFQGDLVSSVVNLSLLRSGELQAHNYVSARLKPFLTNYKVWALSGTEDTVWVKFNFIVNQAAQHFFVKCHEVSHGSGNASFHCHTSRNASVEPQF